MYDYLFLNNIMFFKCNKSALKLWHSENHSIHSHNCGVKNIFTRFDSHLCAIVVKYLKSWTIMNNGIIVSILNKHENIEKIVTWLICKTPFLLNF